jgi:hypothetical protein
VAVCRSNITLELYLVWLWLVNEVCYVIFVRCVGSLGREKILLWFISHELDEKFKGYYVGSSQIFCSHISSFTKICEYIVYCNFSWLMVNGPKPVSLVYCLIIGCKSCLILYYRILVGLTKTLPLHYEGLEF